MKYTAVYQGPYEEQEVLLPGGDLTLRFVRDTPVTVEVDAEGLAALHSAGIDTTPAQED